MKNFALIGLAGFVAPRHLAAIRDTGNNLIAALDISDSVGVVDHFFPKARFFTNSNDFEAFLSERNASTSQQAINYVSICSPNHLHYAHIKAALDRNANVICEKPLVLNTTELDRIQELAQKTNRTVNCVLQLRLHPSWRLVQHQVQASGPRAKVELTYITQRGQWYDVSWKGQTELSGGLAMNIGIHLFDLMIWLFGEVETVMLYLKTRHKIAGRLILEKAAVDWFLSIKGEDIPLSAAQQGRTVIRSVKINDSEIDFAKGFENLHTQVYQQILNGAGFGVDDVRPSIELVNAIQALDVSSIPPDAHPLLLR